MQDRYEKLSRWVRSSSNRQPVELQKWSVQEILLPCPTNKIQSGSFILNGATYNIRPTTHHRPTRPTHEDALCWDAVESLFNGFNLKGYGFADADYGSMHHIRSCGAVTAWKFDYCDSGLSNWQSYE